MCFKSVPDIQLLRYDDGKVITEGVPQVISTYDKTAIEFAIRIKERYGGKVTGITLGNPESKVIKESLAMGIDEVIILKTKNYLDLTLTAKYLSRKINGELIITAEATIEGGTGGLGAYIAKELGVPYVGLIRNLNVEKNIAIIERNWGTYIEILEASLPLVVSVQGDAVQPRIPTLKQILDASKKPVKTEDIVIDDVEKTKLTSTSKYYTKRLNLVFKGEKQKMVEEFIQVLKKLGVI